MLVNQPANEVGAVLYSNASYTMCFTPCGVCPVYVYRAEPPALVHWLIGEKVPWDGSKYNHSKAFYTITNQMIQISESLKNGSLKDGENGLISSIKIGRLKTGWI